MLAISRWSNSESCTAPLCKCALIARARGAVIQSRPADLMSSVIRAWVIYPAITDQHHVVEMEASLELLDLVSCLANAD